VWGVLYLPAARAERSKVPAAERVALDNAVRKLEAIGPDLPYPHSSAVKQADRLRELRPRAGRSPWRAIYRQCGEAFVIAAVCPEAQQDPRGFGRGCADAEERLAELEE
jgi:hypothetical protein